MDLGSAPRISSSAAPSSVASGDGTGAPKIIRSANDRFTMQRDDMIEKTMSILQELVNKITAYNSKANIELVEKAYHFTEKAHSGQLRKSGQPYVTHPLEVAMILAEMKLDVPSIVSGMLHDTIEDTEITRDDIAREFGEDIAALVDGVTKLSKFHFHTREDRQAENFRKMILAMSQDIRVILIKLADRLHNLRTLQFMSEEKQMGIAQETFDIYAPLAHRLGIQWIKVQLEDLSFRFLKPNIYRQLEKKVSRLSKNREDYIARVEDAVRQHFGESIPNFSISGRLKHLYGLYQKMERQQISFEQVHDLIAFRILTNNLEECYEALGLIHSIWRPVPGRFKDYIAMPKPNNYQSLHTTVICLDAERVEFQIRTYEMHEINEQGIAAHWKYKEGGRIDVKDEDTFRWLRQLVEWQNELKDSIEFMDTVKLDLFSSETYIFTPKGDVRALPYDSTPLDFAFSIHTDIGAHCTGAKVNGRIVPLNTKLHSGDTVEILTNPNAHPTKDWLKLVLTSRAKAKIRQYIKQEQRSRSIELGKNIFEEECKKTGLEQQKVLESEEYKKYIEKKGITSEQAFYSALAYGKATLTTLMKQLLPEDHQAQSQVQQQGSVIRKMFRSVSQKMKNAVLVEGVDDLLITYGKCCLPIMGDPIVGFVTRGRGVTLHRTTCSKVPAIDPQRRVNAEWNKNVELIRTARLKISSEDRPGILASIATVVAEQHVNITRALIRTTKDQKAKIFLDVEVPNTEKLHSVTKNIEGISAVIAVDREMG